MYVVFRLPGIANLVNHQNSAHYGHVIVPHEEDVLSHGADWDAVASHDGHNGLHQVPRWCNSVGQYLIESASVTVGGQVIDTIFNDFMFIWEELCGKTGKRLAEMTLRTNSAELSQHWSMFDRCLYVPLPFFFTMTSGTVLPLVSLQFHDVKVYCEFNSVEKAICNYQAEFEGCPSKTVVRNKMAKGALCPIKSNHNLQEVNNGHVQTALEICYVYLDVDERSKFAEGSFEMLVNQVQVVKHVTNNAHNVIRLDFNHAVSELIWAVRKQSSKDVNDHFNFSGVLEPHTGANRDPVVSQALKLNNQLRFGGSGTDPCWYRLVQPYQHHTNIPEQFIYCYSFALFPEDPQPTGTLNFSRIDNATLQLDLDPSLFSNNTQTGGDDNSSHSVECVIIARNINILRIAHGLGGLAYAN